MKKNEKYKLKKIKEREEFEKTINDVNFNTEAGKRLINNLYNRIEEGERREHKRKIILAALGGAALLALSGYGVKKGYDFMKENVSVEFENPMDEEIPNKIVSNDAEETVSSNNIEETVSSNEVKPEENKNTKKMDTKNYKGKPSIKSLLKEMDLPNDIEFKAELAVLYGIVTNPEEYDPKEYDMKLYNAIMERGLVLVLDDNGNIIGFKTDEEDSKTYELSDEASKQITDKVNSIVNQRPSSKPNHKTTTGNKEEQNKEQQTTDQTDQSQENTDNNNLNQGQGGENQGQGGNSGGNHNSGNPNQGGNSGGNTSVETPVNPNPPVDPTPVEPIDPTPVEPVDPTPVEPVDPTPVEPVDPTPVDPEDPGKR